MLEIDNRAQNDFKGRPSKLTPRVLDRAQNLKIGSCYQNAALAVHVLVKSGIYRKAFGVVLQASTAGLVTRLYSGPSATPTTTTTRTPEISWRRLVQPLAAEPMPLAPPVPAPAPAVRRFHEKDQFISCGRQVQTTLVWNGTLDENNFAEPRFCERFRNNAIFDVHAQMVTLCKLSYVFVALISEQANWIHSDLRCSLACASYVQHFEVTCTSAYIPWLKVNFDLDGKEVCKRHVVLIG